MIRHAGSLLVYFGLLMLFAAGASAQNASLRVPPQDGQFDGDAFFGASVQVYRVNEAGVAHLVSSLSPPQSAGVTGFTGGLSYDPVNEVIAVGVLGNGSDILGQVFFYGRKKEKWSPMPSEDSMQLLSTRTPASGASRAKIVVPQLA